MKTIATKEISGVTTFGKKVAYKIEAVINPESRDLQGRWVVMLNGKPIRWYAMESPALRCVRKAHVGMYGISFGESF